MGFLLIGVLLLQIGNLLLQRRIVTAGFLQILKLFIPVRNRLFQGLVFLVYLVEPCLCDKVSIKGIHHLFCLFLRQSHCNQIFFVHCVYLPFKFSVFYRG